MSLGGGELGGGGEVGGDVEPAPVYSLSPRQTRLYRDLATIYKLNNGTGSAETYEQKYQHVPFLFAPTTNFDASQGGTQPNSVNLFTADMGHFHSSQEIEDKWVVYIEPGSAHSPGTWHKVLGASRTLPVLAESRQVFMGSILALKPTQILGIDDGITL